MFGPPGRSHNASDRCGNLFITVKLRGGDPHELLSRSCSGTTRARFTGAKKGGKIENLSWPTRGPFSWTRSGTCPSIYRAPSCCGAPERCSGVGGRKPADLLNILSFPLPTGIWIRWWRREIPGGPAYRLNIFEIHLPPPWERLLGTFCWTTTILSTNTALLRWDVEGIDQRPWTAPAATPGRGISRELENVVHT